MVLHLTSSHSAPFVRFLPLCCAARNAPSTKVLAPCIYSNKPAAVRTSKLPSPGSALHKDRPSCEIILGLSISWGRRRPCAEQTKEATASRPSPTQETQHLPHTHTIPVEIGRHRPAVSWSTSTTHQFCQCSTKFGRWAELLEGKLLTRSVRAGGHPDGTDPLLSNYHGEVTWKRAGERQGRRRNMDPRAEMEAPQDMHWRLGLLWGGGPKSLRINK